MVDPKRAGRDQHGVGPSPGGRGPGIPKETRTLTADSPSQAWVFPASSVIKTDARVRHRRASDADLLGNHRAALWLFVAPVRRAERAGRGRDAGNVAARGP